MHKLGENMNIIKSISILAYSAMISHQANAYTGHDLDQWIASYGRLVNNTASIEDEMNSELLIGYVSGVFDALNLTETICPPANITLSQMIAVVKKEHINSPEKWDGGAGAIATIGLVKAFACKK
jgi:hypothetical protein